MFVMGLGNSTTLNGRVPGDLFTPGEAGIAFFRYAAFARCANGDLLVFATGFTDGNGTYGAYLVYKRSTDNGLNWGAPQIVITNATPGVSALDEPHPVVDRNGTVHLLYNQGGAGSTFLTQVWRVASADNGLTWGTPTDISNSVRGASLVKTGAITSIANNGSGNVRITTSAPHGLVANAIVRIAGTSGLAGLNADFTVTAAGASTLDLGLAFSGTPTGGTWTALWNYHALGLGKAIKLSTNRLVATAYHRYTQNESGTAYADCLLSDDDGVTWYPSASVNEAVAINADKIEPSVVEQDVAGHLYMTARDKTSNPCHRVHSYSTDGGQTWSDFVKDDGTGGTTKIEEVGAQGCQGQLLRLPSGVTIQTQPNFALDRVRMTAHASTDLGASSAAAPATFPNKRVLWYGIGHYSDSISLGPGSDDFLVAFERGFENSPVVQYIALVRVSLDYVLAGSTGNAFDWHCNDEPAGQPVRRVLDVGGLDGRLRVVSADAVPPQYVAGGIQLIDDALTATKLDHQFEGIGAFTFEMAITINAGANGVVYGDQPTVSSGVASGWAMEVAGNKVKVSIGDGVAHAAITGATTVNDGALHTLHFVRDKANNLLKLYVDGASDATAVSDAAVNTNTKNSQDKRIGQWNDGTGQLACTIRRIRRTDRALTPAEFITAGDAPQPSRIKRAATPSDAPSTVANCRSWVFPMFDPVPNLFNNINLYENIVDPPATHMAWHSFYDLVGGYPVDTQGSQVVMHPRYGYDGATVGPYVDHQPNPISNNAGAIPSWFVRNSLGTNTPNLDFIQNTGVFTFCGVVKFTDVAAQNRWYLFSNNHGVGTQNGSYLCLVRATRLLELFITGGGTARLSAVAPVASALTLDQWYFVAVSLGGNGTGPVWYVQPWGPTGTVPTKYTTSTGSKTTYDAPGTYNSANLMMLMGNNNISTTRGGFRDLCLFDRQLSDAEVQARFDFRTPLGLLSRRYGRTIDGSPFGGLVA